MSTANDDWLAFDRKHVWHPYTSVTAPGPMFPVRSAHGVRIVLEDGRELIDGMASWWSVIHGYAHPKLLDALHRQADALAHVMFGGLTHRPAVELAQRLVEMTPDGLDHVFFADSGSVAMEVALKMALQYQHGIGETARKRFVTIRRGYHGDTFGAMSVCDPDTGMHQLFDGFLPKQLFIDAPGCRSDAEWDDLDLSSLRVALDEHGHEIAALVLEPVVQGAGGMRFYAPEWLRQARRLCDAHGVLLVADEIATGFGRSGTLFACDRAGVVPDVMAVGKALCGGMMTLAATLATGRVAEGIGRVGPLMHGPTFMANPLATAVAGASLDLLHEEPWEPRVARIESELRSGLQACHGMPAVADVRVLGAIGVVELHEPVVMADVQPRFVDRGVWVRPFGELVYVMPPYVIDTEDLARVTGAICGVVSELPAPRG